MSNIEWVVKDQVALAAELEYTRMELKALEKYQKACVNAVHTGADEFLKGNFEPTPELDEFEKKYFEFGQNTMEVACVLLLILGHTQM